MKNPTPWLIAAFVVGLLYLLSPILLPFVLGMGIAYFLDPIVNRLDKMGLPRSIASLVPVLLFFIGIALVSAALIPHLVEDIVAFTQRLPEYLTLLEDALHEEGQISTFMAGYGIDLNTLISYQTLSNYSQELAVIGKKTLTNLALSTLAIGEIISLLVITPMVVYYLLADWPHFTDKVKKLLPAKKRNNILKTWKEMDAKLAQFLRGQISVSILLGLFYGIGLTMVGTSMGFAIGFTAGLLSFIPYVGMLIGLVCAGAVTCVQFQFTSIDPYLAVLGVFMAGQLIEGFFLTPRLVGKEVGLHPVWVIFAVMAGGQLGGFLGVLLALPAASVLTVLVPKLVHLWQQTTKAS